MATLRGIDRYGAEWSLFEVDRRTRRQLSPHVADGWLCFERADGHVVRIPRGEYPRDWSKRPVAELLELIGRGARGDRDD